MEAKKGELIIGDKKISVKNIKMELNYTIPNSLKNLAGSLVDLNESFGGAVIVLGNVAPAMRRIARAFRGQERSFLEIKKLFSIGFSPNVAGILFHGVRHKSYTIGIVKLLVENGATADDIFWFLVKIRPEKMYIYGGSLYDSLKILFSMNHPSKADIRKWINTL